MPQGRVKNEGSHLYIRRAGILLDCCSSPGTLPMMANRVTEIAGANGLQEP